MKCFSDLRLTQAQGQSSLFPSLPPCHFEIIQVKYIYITEHLLGAQQRTKDTKTDKYKRDDKCVAHFQIQMSCCEFMCTWIFSVCVSARVWTQTVVTRQMRTIQSWLISKGLWVFVVQCLQQVTFRAPNRLHLWMHSVSWTSQPSRYGEDRSGQGDTETGVVDES